MVSSTSAYIDVRLGGRSGCSACDAGRGCGAGVFGRMLHNRPVQMTFENTVQAQVGQAVTVGLPETLFLTLALRFYLYPLLAALAGAVAGHWAASRLGAGTGWTDAAALGGGLAAAWLMMKVIRAIPMEFSERPAVHLLGIVMTQNSEC